MLRITMNVHLVYRWITTWYTLANNILNETNSDAKQLQNHTVEMQRVSIIKMLCLTKL